MKNLREEPVKKQVHSDHVPVHVQGAGCEPPTDTSGAGTHLAQRTRHLEGYASQAKDSANAYLTGSGNARVKHDSWQRQAGQVGGTCEARKAREGSGALRYRSLDAAGIRLGKLQVELRAPRRTPRLNTANEEAS